MSLIRIQHNRSNPYVMLNKQPLFDKELSFKAKGLWAQCLARKDNWKFHVKELAQNSSEGKDAIYSAIHELIKNRYAIHYQNRTEGGKFGSHDYIIFEFQLTPDEYDKEKKRLENPQAGNPFTDSPDAENPDAAFPDPAPSAPHIYSSNERVEQVKGEAPLKPPPTTCSASEGFKKTVEMPLKHPADRSNEENIAILKADLGRVFNESQLARAIDFFLRMPWKELRKEKLNLSGWVRKAIEGNWDIERGSRAFRPHKESQAACIEKEREMSSGDERFWEKAELEVTLAEEEIMPTISQIAERVFEGHYIGAAKIEACLDSIVFSWESGGFDLSYQLPFNEFYSQLKNHLKRWRLDYRWIEEEFVQSYCVQREMAGSPAK